jgi:hypothetical protein
MFSLKCQLPDQQLCETVQSCAGLLPNQASDFSHKSKKQMIKLVLNDRKTRPLIHYTFEHILLSGSIATKCHMP